VCVCACAHTCVRVNGRVGLWVVVNRCVWMCACAYVCVCVCVRMRTRVRVYYFPFSLFCIAVFRSLLSLSLLHTHIHYLSLSLALFRSLSLSLAPPRTYTLMHQDFVCAYTHIHTHILTHTHTLIVHTCTNMHNSFFQGSRMVLSFSRSFARVHHSLSTTHVDESRQTYS